MTKRRPGPRIARVRAVSLPYSRFCSPQSHISSRMGIRDCPRSVRLYSTLGGLWGYSSRWTSWSAPQLLEGGAEGLVEDLSDIPLYLVEADHPEAGQGVEHGHLVLFVDERQGMAEPGGVQMLPLMGHLRWKNLGHVLAGGNGEPEIRKAYDMGNSIA